MAGIPNNDYFQSFKNSMLSATLKVAENLIPVLTTSKFKETGVLTPTEFVEAGDQLVTKCPSWSWSGGDVDKRRAYLPPNKQFLITKGVPCPRRVRALDAAWGKVEESEVDGDWLATGGGGGTVEGGAGNDYGNMEEEEEDDKTSNDKSQQQQQQQQQQQHLEEEDEDYIDLESYEELGVVNNDQNTVKVNTSSNSSKNKDDAVLKTRTYDLYIMYDKFYQTPRMFLAGYDEAGRPLPPAAVFEDISQDYANKTATIEPHPHIGNLPCASIHPCKHAHIMKKIYDNLTSDGSEARVDQALFVFLKFMQGIIPTINFDFTMDVKMKR